MLRIASTLVLALVLSVAITPAQQPSTTGPYKVLKSARVGGEGNWDYIYADVVGRRLYIPRRAPAVPAGAEGSAPTSTVRTRLTIFNLDTLEPAGEIDGVGGQGTAVDPKSGHGFTSSRPVTMFDTKTQKLMKTIDTADAQGDGIVFDSFNERVYVFSHPTKDATVIADSSQSDNFLVQVECSHTHVDTTSGLVTMRTGSSDKQVVAGTSAIAGNLAQKGCAPCLRPIECQPGFRANKPERRAWRR